MLIPPTSQNNAIYQKMMKPMITFRFDDGFVEDYDNAFPALKAAGMRASFYPISGRFGESASLTEEQVREMAHAGQEIGSHTHQHIDLTSETFENDEDLMDELIKSKTLIEEATGKEVYGITPPNHGYNERIDRFIHGVYEYSSVRPENHSASQSMQYYTRYGTQRNTTTQTISRREIDRLKDFVDETIEKKVWTIMHTHKIDDVPPLEEGAYDLSLETFLQLLDYINTKRPHEVDVVTIREGVRRVQGIPDPNLMSDDAYYDK